MDNVVPPEVLERKRHQRRLEMLNNSIDHFVRMATEANAMAIMIEDAKLRYLDLLSLEVRQDLGY